MKTIKITITEKNKWILDLLDEISKRKEELRLKLEKRTKEKYNKH